MSVSEQQLCDCSWDYGNEGCMGGLPWLAFNYLIDTKGDEGETDYPYTAKVCSFQSIHV